MSEPAALALSDVSLEAAAFRPTKMYFLLRDTIVPQPIAWVSTISDRGRTNLAPFSFFNVVCPYPPVLGSSCGGDDHGAALRARRIRSSTSGRAANSSSISFPSACWTRW